MLIEVDPIYRALEILQSQGWCVDHDALTSSLCINEPHKLKHTKMVDSCVFLPERKAVLVSSTIFIQSPVTTSGKIFLDNLAKNLRDFNMSLVWCEGNKVDFQWILENPYLFHAECPSKHITEEIISGFSGAQPLFVQCIHSLNICARRTIAVNDN